MLPDEFEDFEENVNEPEITREDKIFNNRYNSGDGLIDPDVYAYNSKLSVNSEYSGAFLKDIYESEYQLEYSNCIDNIFEFFKTDPEIMKIVDLNEKKAGIKSKFSKEDINSIFNRTHEMLSIKEVSSHFFSPIYILEAVSAISSMEYKKIFDSLETDIQEILIIELNKKYNFLDGRFNKKRIH